MRRRNNKGFTLLELIIAISILVVVLAMVTVIFRATQESFANAMALQKVIDTSRRVIERMHNEISTAFFDEQGRTGLLGIDGETGTRIKTQSDGDEIFFCVPIAQLNTSDIIEVGYWVKDDGNLMRHFDSGADYDYATEDADDELGLVIDQLTFKYFNGELWVDEWNAQINDAEQGKAPKAIRATFTISDKSNIISKDFETVVHLNAGKRY